MGSLQHRQGHLPLPQPASATREKASSFDKNSSTFGHGLYRVWLLRQAYAALRHQHEPTSADIRAVRLLMLGCSKQTGPVGRINDLI